MNSVACPACLRSTLKEPRRVPDYEYGIPGEAVYAHCADCGTAFQLPMPDEKALAASYPPDYHSMSADGALRRLKHATRLKRLTRLVSKKAIVLDYGCGDGAFARYAAKAAPGWTIYGFEPGPRPRVDALAPNAARVEGGLEDLARTVPVCDLISMNHVIEHLPDPERTLLELAGRLRQGGMLEGQTPAAGSFEHRFFKGVWSGYHSPRHTVIFSQVGLKVFLERCGFSGARLSGAFNPASGAVSLATAFRPGRRRVRRKGASWLGWVALGSILGAIDLISGKPSVVDFYGVKK